MAIHDAALFHPLVEEHLAAMEVAVDEVLDPVGLNVRRERRGAAGDDIEVLPPVLP